MTLRPRTVDAPGGPLVVFESDDVDRDLDDAIARGGPTPYGRVLWDAAAPVARALAAMPLAGARVLELGCGTGLVSLVAARMGAHVLATDVDEVALGLVARAADEAGVTVVTAIFDVCGAAPLPQCDIVVAADLTYEPGLAAAMARRVVEAKRAGCRVVVGDPGRVFRDHLVRLAAEQGVTLHFAGVDAHVGVAVV